MLTTSCGLVQGGDQNQSKGMGNISGQKYAEAPDVELDGSGVRLPGKAQQMKIAPPLFRRRLRFEGERPHTGRLAPFLTLGCSRRWHIGTHACASSDPSEKGGLVHESHAPAPPPRPQGSGGEMQGPGRFGLLRLVNPK